MDLSQVVEICRKTAGLVLSTCLSTAGAAAGRDQDLRAREHGQLWQGEAGAAAQQVLRGERLPGRPGPAAQGARWGGSYPATPWPGAALLRCPRPRRAARRAPRLGPRLRRLSSVSMCSAVACARLHGRAAGRRADRGCRRGQPDPIIWWGGGADVGASRTPSSRHPGSTGGCRGVAQDPVIQQARVTEDEDEVGLAGGFHVSAELPDQVRCRWGLPCQDHQGTGAAIVSEAAGCSVTQQCGRPRRIAPAHTCDWRGSRGARMWAAKALESGSALVCRSPASGAPHAGGALVVVYDGSGCRKAGCAPGVCAC